MRYLLYVPLLAVAGILFLGAVAAADDYYMYGFEGSGNFLSGPPFYGGTFTFGLSGTWEFEMDDSDWPSAENPEVRWQYVWENYFEPHYDGTAGAENWTATFDGTSLPSSPVFGFDISFPAGFIGGTLSIDVMVRDNNPLNGELDPAELHNVNVDALMVVDRDLGTGAFESLCGEGSLHSMNVDIVFPPEVDYMTGFGSLLMYDCGADAEDNTWGGVKALYR